MKNKYCLILLFISIIIAIYFYLKSMTKEQELDTYARLTNNLKIMDSFERYLAIKENNSTKIQNSLDSDFMFSLTGVEIHGIKNTLSIKRMDHMCIKYKRVSSIFEKEYGNKYPSAIQELNTFCK